MVARTYAIGELKITIEAPTEELVDALTGSVGVHSTSALMDEQAIQAAGGLRVFDKVDPTDRSLHASMTADLGGGEKAVMPMFLFPYGRNRPPSVNPYMEQLRRDQAAELAQERASETVPG